MLLGLNFVQFTKPKSVWIKKWLLLEGLGLFFLKLGIGKNKL